MKIRWGEEKIKGFSSPVKNAEVNDNWVWWALFVVVVMMGVLFILKTMGKI